MWKKILVSFFICSALLTVGSISYATGGTNDDVIKTVKKEVKEIDKSNYQLTSPEKESYTSKDKIAFINGKAPSGTSITIEVYGTTDLTRKSFNLSKLPKDEDYIEINSETIEVGNMGFFDKQIDLVTGINKMVIKFNVEGVPSREIIILVEPKSSGTNKEVKLTDIMSLMK